MSFVQLRGITKSYGATNVLDGIDLSIEEGEFVSLLGPSGCGKTTTLRIIAGFDRADAGSLEVGGERLDDVPAHKRNIGVVFQHYALFPHMTVFQNVAFGLRERKVAKREIATRVHEALDTVQMGDVGQRMPSALSGGQQQRIALARALVIRPRVLLLDESLGALDKRLRTDMQVELRRIQREYGITTVFVTHDQEEALTLSDRIAVMNAGHILQFDTPAASYETPSSPYVAAALGEANILTGVARSTRAGEAELTGAADGTAPAVPFTCRRPLSDGAACTLVVRPQDVRVHPDDPTAGRWTGRIRFVSFAGSMSHLIVDAYGQQLKVQVPHDAEHAFELREGQQVGLSWASSRVHAIPGGVDAQDAEAIAAIDGGADDLGTRGTVAVDSGR